MTPTQPLGSLIAADAPGPPQVLIGRCSVCRAAFRAEIPATVIVCSGSGWATSVARNYGYPVQHDCRAGIPCPPEGENGLPACGFWDCDGHDLTQIAYKPLRVTYKPGAVCGPGNCGGAVTATCVCSCSGANHGSSWAASGGVKPPR
jgi:hypothetical protein